MTGHTFRPFAFVAAGVAVAVIGLAALGLALSGNFDGFLVAAPLGGLVIALLLGFIHARGRAPQAAPDPFARDSFAFDVLNVSHVRVAGLGGLGLILISAVVVLQYELLTAAMALGLAGGILCGGALIVYRRTHPQPAHRSSL